MHNSLLHDYSPETNKLNRYNNIIPCKTCFYLFLKWIYHIFLILNFLFLFVRFLRLVKHSIVKLPVCPGCSHSLDESEEEMPQSESSQYINANYINVSLQNFLILKIDKSRGPLGFTCGKDELRNQGILLDCSLFFSLFFLLISLSLALGLIRINRAFIHSHSFTPLRIWLPHQF